MSGNIQKENLSRMDLLRKFAGGVAHDVNNLLTGIMGFAMLIQEEVEEQTEIHQYTKQIEKAALKCQQLTDKLISFAKKEALSTRELDLNDVIVNALDTLEEKIGIKVGVETKFGEVSPVIADSEKIGRAIVCIIADAAYRMKEIDEISISTQNIHADNEYLKAYPALDAEGKYVLVTMSVPGVNIPEEELCQVFEPVYKTERDMVLGCELAVAKEIVKSHEGAISVEQSDTGGVIFNIWLPVAQSSK